MGRAEQAVNPTCTRSDHFTDNTHFCIEHPEREAEARRTGFFDHQGDGPNPTRDLTQDEADYLDLDDRDGMGTYTLAHLQRSELICLFERATRKSYHAADVEDIVAALEPLDWHLPHIIVPVGGHSARSWCQTHQEYADVEHRASIICILHGPPSR